MKAVFGLILIIAAVGVGFYFFGGYSTLDPNKQGADAKAAIKPGMTLAQVLDVAAPNEYRQVTLQKQKVPGSKQEIVTPMMAAPVKFVRKRVEDRVKNGDMPDGFVLPYKFSNSIEFEVWFDKSGVVTEVRDVQTMADLLK